MKVKMVASENLLQSVIISQNADMMNGVRELIQNGMDSYYGLQHAKNILEISLVGKSVDDWTAYNTLIYRDYGMSFGNTEEEVISNFFVFGNSGKSAEQLGKFGIGRGQIMAMIYNADTKQLQGTHTIKTGKWKISEIDIINLDAKIELNDDYIEGTEWTIQSNSYSFNADDIQSFLIEKIYTLLDIVFNGTVINHKPKGIPVVTDLCDVYFDESVDGGYFDIYERGIYVTGKYMVLGLGGKILTKTPLELNFARNEIVENSTWKEIVSSLFDCCYERITTRDFNIESNSTRNGILRLYLRDMTKYSELEKLPIVVLANNTIVTMEQVRNAGVIYRAGKNSRSADAAIQMGFFVIDDDSPLYYGAPVDVEELSSSEVGQELIKTAFATVETSKDYALLLDELNALEKPKDANSKREFFVGTASEIIQGWTDGISIHINRTYLDKFSKLTISEKVLALMPLIAHEYSHYNADTANDVHDYRFFERTTEILDSLVSNFVHTLHN